MFEKPDCEEFRVSTDQPAGKIEEPLQRDHTRRVSLQTEEGKTLIGVPITVGAIEAVPRILLAPAQAIICATGLVAKVAGLKIVVERIE